MEMHMIKYLAKLCSSKRVGYLFVEIQGVNKTKVGQEFWFLGSDFWHLSSIALQSCDSAEFMFESFFSAFKCHILVASKTKRK